MKANAVFIRVPGLVAAMLFVTGALSLGGQAAARAGSLHVSRFERRIGVERTVSLKAFIPSGEVHIRGWDADSLVVRAQSVSGIHFLFGGDARGVKFGIDDAASGRDQAATVEIWLPRNARVSIKGVSTRIDATDLSGWFYTVSGGIRIRGRAEHVEAESMTGAVDVDVTAPWVRARTTVGSLAVRGAVTDVSASTISGSLSIALPQARRGRFGSVTGDIRFAGDVASGGVLEFDDHDGAVELRLPPAVSSEFVLATILGSVTTAFETFRPAGDVTRHDREQAFRMGAGGAFIRVRTFRGPIRVAGER
ncbi:MAG: DUF4097 family beta strand repeat-containing protein [Gemmatimonadaceae bacterium]